MSNSPVTVAERFSAIGGAAIFALVIFGVATLLHNAISRNDDRKRVQGRPIRWWVTGLYLVGAFVGAILADNKQYYMHEVVGGLGGFGSLAGLVIGNIHGGINLVLKPDPTQSRGSEGDIKPLPAGVLIPRINDNGNPYAPPRQQ